MNKFWNWFIPFILIICLVIYSLILKINNIHKLVINNVLEEPKFIVNISNRNVYSKYDINLYNNIPLDDYLKDDDNINLLLDSMTFKDELNDGGTKIFYSDKIANMPFYLIVCNNLNGNNDIYILNDEDVRYCG